MNASKNEPLDLIQKGVTQDNIINELNVKSNKLPDNIIILADDYLLSYTYDKLVNKTNAAMYILPQTIEYFRKLKDLPVFLKIINALTDPYTNINIFEKFTFYEQNDRSKKCNNIDLLIKIGLFLKSSGFNVSIMTNDLNTIYFSLVNNIKIIHSMPGKIHRSKIKSNAETKISVYDTCYLMKFISEIELYNNFPKVIYSCVLEELIKNNDKITSIPNLIYKLVDCIQDENFNINLEVNFSTNYLNSSVWTDSLILFVILSKEDYKNNFLLKTSDCQLEIEALMYGIKLDNRKNYNTTIEVDKTPDYISNNPILIDTANEFNQSDILVNNNRIEKFLTIPLKKISKSWYVSLEIKNQYSLEIVSSKNFENIIYTNKKIISNQDFFEVTINSYILIDNKIYKIIQMKGKNNLKFTREK